MSLIKSAVVVGVAVWISSPHAALAQRSASAQIRSDTTGARGGDGRSGHGAASGRAHGTGRSDRGARGMTTRGPVEGRRGLGPGVGPWFWWPYAAYAYDIPRAVEANENDGVVAIPVPPPPIKSAEPSSIQPLPLLQPPQTSSQSPRGNLRLEVRPDTAQVYVDGFYSGTVTDSNRSPAGLNLTIGWHRLEFRAPGHETPAVNVTIVPNQTTSYRGELKAIGH